MLRSSSEVYLAASSLLKYTAVLINSLNPSHVNGPNAEGLSRVRDWVVNGYRKENVVEYR